MKKLFLFSLLLLLWTSCQDRPTALSSPDAAATPTATKTVDTLSAIVAQVRGRNRLHTTEFQIHKVVLYEDKAKLGGKLLDIDMPGHRKIAVPIDITLKGYIDFKGFSAANVKLIDSLAILTLPDPGVTVTSLTVDRKHTRQYVSIARANFSDAEITRLVRQGEDSVMRHVSRFGIVEAALESAARTLVPLLCRMGFKESNIIVRFRKDFNADEIRRFVTPFKAH